jgi:hypothetical protein
VSRYPQTFGCGFDFHGELSAVNFEDSSPARFVEDCVVSEVFREEFFGFLDFFFRHNASREVSFDEVLKSEERRSRVVTATALEERKDVRGPWRILLPMRGFVTIRQKENVVFVDFSHDVLRVVVVG